jgi:hypothetical protein
VNRDRFKKGVDKQDVIENKQTGFEQPIYRKDRITKLEMDT